ncbi:MAG: hypothetical protein A2Z91_02175 [Deltaproteobacteria bacterium GWA2_38_16]|nr:MAG: hypothetical protein A2Z91_02175 [Deltaproteobacteria bacterium GWA2_38_16]OGQ02003.1 MAG: hypothetical protein A3D19_08470 [Deltaproteobacteria bacterium RIFCSPHIGHO2_02_FULL_38_15]OGQ33695.1 MAG: hypothetical protein A3A72_05735 [Deltaproteobacteria bacterium RIFCSPLOWO2_01_FULL_38_9]OGQ61053.1 MAG: hypothetical protein A3G92_01940 [Deltaproteobacteria bacterium RIFCSPLOWO2_12_FULL_38_8]HBQ21536.1 hypothetical protein [Deltaproteobacteria bacterium]
MTSHRHISLDALRGLVVVLMALDHVQFFWFSFGLPNDGLHGLIPQYLSSFHQLTRFLSHLCAPTFLFLAGMMVAWKKDPKHIFIRGIILIFLQFTLENIAWWPKGYIENKGYAYFGILSCLGVGMCMLALLSSVRPLFIFIISIFIFFLSQAIVNPMVPNAHPFLQGLAIIFYVPTLEKFYPMTSLFTVIPWVGFMGIGYYIGTKTLNHPLYLYKKTFGIVGLILIITSSVLRYMNGFGNTLHWYGSPFGSDFFILSKYPPSLVFSGFILGIMFLIWALFIHTESKFSRWNPLVVFGQVALFFYLVHLYLYGLGAYIVGHTVGLTHLSHIWGIWFLGLIPLYFLCAFYRNLKTTSPTTWIRYI